MIATRIFVMIVTVPALLAMTAGASIACCKAQFVRTKPHVNVSVNPQPVKPNFKP